jgi:hypothetical protein
MISRAAERFTLQFPSSWTAMAIKKENEKKMKKKTKRALPLDADDRQQVDRGRWLIPR